MALLKEKEIESKLIAYNGYIVKTAQVYFGLNEMDEKVQLQVVTWGKVVEVPNQDGLFMVLSTLTVN